MLDLFTIFTKGGIVLWYFQPTASSLTSAVNALIKSVILQERGGVNAYNHDSLTLKFRLDNEFELVFVAVYQRIIKLSYVDKLLDQVSLEFRDRYKNEVSSGPFRKVNFDNTFKFLLATLEDETRQESLKPKQMRAFQPKTDNLLLSQQPVDVPPPVVMDTVEEVAKEAVDDNKKNIVLAKLGTRGRGKKIAKKMPVAKSSPRAETIKREKKPATKWDGVVSKEEAASLDRSDQSEAPEFTHHAANVDFAPVGNMKSVEPLKYTESAATKAKSESGGGLFSVFSSLGVGKTITRESMAGALEKMTEHLITKNVASAIAEKLCDSVAAKLEGKVIGTFTGVKSTVRASMEESLMQILRPKRRIDILRDVEEAASKGRPYVITFCGVNGVGKSTNLAKIAFWLLENGHRVLIAACDTFRSGAVEQLRTHTSHLSTLHPTPEGEPPKIQLFHQGYNKDSAGVAMEAIHVARTQGCDVVLVDTAGRMQDNEPLMRSLAKLIRVNCPDLVLFVGEALVGNEAVDQLFKFNRALTDHSEGVVNQSVGGATQIIDGILLTKFDTIDDKVGAAISMTYTTGQPIVFVGTGQRYTDLKSLNASAVVSLLLQ